MEIVSKFLLEPQGLTCLNYKQVEALFMTEERLEYYPLFILLLKGNGFMIYFAYGSNMSFKRLNARISNITRLGVATLSQHDLRFHKISEKDGSGKCDIFETNDPDHRVIGVVYEIDPSEKQILDTYEGIGYEVKQVDVELDGNLVSAFAYYATLIDQALQPLHWYKEHVLRGAMENDLPEHYIRKIEMIDSVDDNDEERHKRELEIYSQVF